MNHPRSSSTIDATALDGDLNLETGKAMHRLAERLFPIPRSITGNGVRQSLALLSEELDSLSVHEVPSGTKSFDWTVPPEWNVREAYIEAPDGTRFADFSEHNLHLVGYSEPVDRTLSHDELDRHLYSIPDQPDAIPYVTSYYKRRWGFCLPHRVRESLTSGNYRVRIDSDLADGHLTYGELKIAGETEQEIFISTYICHPMMANNELSGPCVAAFLARWILSLPRRRFSYRFVWVPETIGSIVYLSRHLEELKSRVFAGFNLTCCGDERAYSFLPSRAGDTPTDAIVQHVLHHTDSEYNRYQFTERGSDERQYCSPGVDLPVASLMRSKYHTYPEYHTSLDDLSLVTDRGLAGTLLAHQRCIACLERDCIPVAIHPCEPQLGPRGLYPDLSIRNGADHVRQMMDLLAYCDGKHTLLEIAQKIDQPMWELLPHLDRLVEAELLRKTPSIPSQPG